VDDLEGSRPSAEDNPGCSVYAGRALMLSCP
jgi:hypothetical protein